LSRLTVASHLTFMYNVRTKWPSGDGTLIHWPDLDEDLSVAGILAGRRSGESSESLKKWLAERGA
jgi:hypothetical protein